MEKKTIITIVTIFVLVSGVIGGYFFLYESGDRPYEDPSPEEISLEDIEVAAERWIMERSGTYRERGGKNLELVESGEADEPILYEHHEDKEIEIIDEGVYRLVFRFDTEYKGYGDFDEGEEVAAIETEREAVVRTVNKEIYDVIIDGTYNEKRGQYVHEYEELLPYIEERDEGATLDEIEENAINWIKLHSSTYRERGGKNLELARSEEIDSFSSFNPETNELEEITEGARKLVFEFETTYEGYGRLEGDEEESEEPVSREMEVHMADNLVKSVIVDGVFDEDHRDYVDNFPRFLPDDRPYDKELNEESSFEEIVKNAEMWIAQHSPTYRRRGGTSIEFVDGGESGETLVIYLNHEDGFRKVEDNVYDLTFTIKKTFGGYGPVEEGESLDSAEEEGLAEHEVVVRTYHNQVNDVIIDGVYNDWHAEYMNDYEQILPYDEELKKNIALEEIVQNATNWIRTHSPTYRDREGSDLELVNVRELEGKTVSMLNEERGVAERFSEGIYELSFVFQTSYEGYGGEREGGLVEGEGEREMVMRMVHNQVHTAVVDGVYVDSEGKYLAEHRDTVVYNETLNRDATLEEIESNAKRWISTESPTYQERGGSNLELVSSEKLEGESMFWYDPDTGRMKEFTDEFYEMVFTFQTEYDGYGMVLASESPRANNETRELVVRTVHNQVYSAVVDGEYDDYKGSYIN